MLISWKETTLTTMGWWELPSPRNILSHFKSLARSYLLSRPSWTTCLKVLPAHFVFLCDALYPSFLSLVAVPLLPSPNQKINSMRTAAFVSSVHCNIPRVQWVLNKYLLNKPGSISACLDACFFPHQVIQSQQNHQGLLICYAFPRPFLQGIPSTRIHLSDTLHLENFYPSFKAQFKYYPVYQSTVEIRIPMISILISPITMYFFSLIVLRTLDLHVYLLYFHSINYYS